MTEPLMYRIVLTAAQADQADWAIGPMEECFEGMVSEGELAAMPVLPRLEGRALVITDQVAVLEDILYRLEEQLPAMAEQAGERGGVRAAEALADKIRAATGFTGEGR